MRKQIVKACVLALVGVPLLSVAAAQGADTAAAPAAAPARPRPGERATAAPRQPAGSQQETTGPLRQARGPRRQAAGAQEQAAGTRGQEVRLGLQEVVQLAFEHNLDIVVVDYDREIARENIVAARGAFDPVFRFGGPGAAGATGGGFGAPIGGAGGLGFTSAQEPSTSQLAGADVVENETFSTAATLSQTLPFGLDYSLTYQLSRNSTNSIFNSLNPAYDNTLSFALTQPLLRGRGYEATAAQLRLARRNEDVARESFRTQVETILLQAVNAYWQVVFARRDLEVREQSLTLAEEQLERTRAQVEVGVLAPVQETQARAAVAARRGDRIVARSGLQNALDELRALLDAGSLPAGWETELVLTDEPEAATGVVDLAVAERLALERRPEVAQARAQIGARTVELDAARNELLPRLDLVAGLDYAGIGGDLIVRDGFFGDVIEVQPGGYGDALEQLFSLDVPTWQVGVNFSMPIRNLTAKGNYARATLAEDQARAELRRVEQQVVLEVRQAARRMEDTAELIESSRLARELAEEQLAVEQDRFDVGMSTNFEVLEFQDDLAQARSAELRAMIDYRLAEADLARATGTLLSEYGIGLTAGR